MEVGRPVSAILYGISRGPLMLYSGQEVGEPAEGAEGFGADDARTTLFDYWSMPEFVKWVNDHQYDGGKLSDRQKSLRAFYAGLLKLTAEPAFRNGSFFGLNAANRENPQFGRVGRETAGGHWLYAFLRRDPNSGQKFLVVVNLNKSAELKHTQVRFPREALAFLGIDSENDGVKFRERLSNGPVLAAELKDLRSRGLEIPSIPALTPYFFEILPAKQ
jgi:hypothetical protein